MHELKLVCTPDDPKYAPQAKVMGDLLTYWATLYRVEIEELAFRQFCREVEGNPMSDGEFELEVKNFLSSLDKPGDVNESHSQEA